VKVTLDRSTVAMGDDVESHRVFWIFPASATVDDLLVEISTHYLPGVAGPVGWCVDVNTADQIRRLELGVIYTRDDLKQEGHLQIGHRHNNIGRSGPTGEAPGP
jgi:hypothetical protein